MFVAYIIWFVAKFTYNFIRCWYVTLDFTNNHLSVTCRFHGFYSWLIFVFRRCCVDINTWHTVLGLLLNTIQQSKVFYLTNCKDSVLYNVLLVFVKFIVFKEISSNRDLRLGTFFCLSDITLSFWKQRLPLN